MDDSGFLCLTGGYVELGETTETAVIREMNEEVNSQFDIKDYLGVVENYFINKRNKKMHEISFYYLLSMRGEIDTKDFTVMENDKGRTVKLDFKWISLSEINNYDIRPVFLKEVLSLNDLKFNHLIFNELEGYNE